MPPAASVMSPTSHGNPLTPGPGSLTVMIGLKPAWRALPSSMASAVEGISNAMDTFMKKPQMTPADAGASIAEISQKLVQGGAAAAAAGSPAPAAAAGAAVPTLIAANIALTATWTAAVAVPGAQPAANIAYTEGIKAATAAAASAVMSSMAGLSDMHVCPLPTPIPPHGPGFVTNGSATVLIEKLSAARQGDKVFEACGGPDPIAMGCPTVIIGDAGGGGAGGAGGGAGAVPKGCEYLNKPYTVEAPVKEFDRIRSGAKLGSPTEGKHTFPGDKAPSDAIIQDVEVKGRTVKLVLPKSGAPAGKHLPTADQIAKALGAVPGDQLDSIKEVVVSPNQNPSDAYWAKEYKIPDFSSAATGGPGGVTFYPKKSPWDQAFVDSTSIHEGGHAYSLALWKDPEKKKAWEAAIKKDGRSPSTYADSSTGEDFSESLVMYSLSKGTECEAAAKARYPARYEALDALFKK